MRRLSALALTALAATAMTGLSASPALAEERTCRGSLGAITVDNLRVPSGATCTLNGTFVKGTVLVQTSATLRASNIRVVGNVQAEGANQVTVTGSRIGGSVQIKQGGGATLLRNTVNADIQYDEMRRLLRTNGNVVGGNVQIVKNFGGVEVNNNRIDGALQCKENSPAPTGSGNTASSKEDQCSRL
jgi:hypothetical protein